MRLLILYRPNSEHARAMETFIHDYQERHEESKLEVLNVDGRDGSAQASLYDVMRYPAILALRDDGSVLKSWEGEELPLMDEVAYYVFGAN
jgi:hypothetical protein